MIIALKIYRNNRKETLSTMYVIVAILAFGLLIAVHELGHFLTAKLMDVRVNEFAIGMGPKILKKQGKETLYSLRLLPLGGFCAMDEDEAKEGDPRAFTSKKRWKRAVIFLAGSLANLLTAFIIVVIITLSSGATEFRGTTIDDLIDSAPIKGEHGLMAGDTIVSINGDRLFYAQDFSMFVQLSELTGRSNVDLVISRDGQTINLNNFPLQRHEFIENGELVYRFGIVFNTVDATFSEQLRYSAYLTFNFVRMIRVSLAQLISGQAGLGDVSGMVGIVDAINTAAQEAPNVGAALGNIAFFTAFIGVNLAVMNLLPIPALDGGRILFLFISFVIEKIIRKDLDPKYEGYIHTGTMVLLLGFMVFILFNDVITIIGRQIAG